MQQSCKEGEEIGPRLNPWGVDFRADLPQDDRVINACHMCQVSRGVSYPKATVGEPGAQVLPQSYSIRQRQRNAPVFWEVPQVMARHSYLEG